MNEIENARSKAQTHNIKAAKTVAETVKSTLGPMGMDKLMMDGGGNVIVTNDGATILRELDVTHPGGKMIVEVAKTQESLCYDGTTSTVILAGQLLANSESLFEKGLHPNVICRGYHEATRMAIKFLNEEITITSKERNDLVAVAKTAITGKTLENAIEDVAELCVAAVEKAGDAESVKVVSFPGDSIQDSYLYDGCIVNKDYVLEGRDEYSHLVLMNTGLENEKSEDNIQLQMNSESFQSYKASSKTHLIESAKRLVEYMPEGGVVFVRDNVNDFVCSYLKKNHIMVVRRVPESTLRTLSRVADTPICQTPEEVEFCAPVKIKREKHNDVWYLFVNGELESNVATLVLRGATSHTLDEVERGFDDALGVVSLVMNSKEYVIGGGNSYARMSSHLRQHAAKIGGRAQMAIEAFSDALEIIPATIAENAGHDPLDVVLAMRHEILQGNLTFGPDVENGGVCDMLKAGVIEPASLVKQAVQSASEVTNSVLRIDDIIARRPTQ
jgi:chaperonin GroEL (HSP60 family)|tara:strand:- start:706 stop:2208 length:1503 start_codon:yes stop_codon:yes gene_type:complete